MIALACDVDGVLCESDGPLCAAITRETGIPLHPDQVVCWDFYHHYLGQFLDDPDAFLQAFWSDPVIARGLPFVLPALPAVRELRGLVDRLVVLTARDPTCEELRVATRLWLDRYGIDYDAIVHTRDKAAACADQAITYLVEDAPDHAEACAAIGIRVYLVDKPYNRAVVEGSRSKKGFIRRVEQIGEVPPLVRADLRGH